MSLPWYVVSPEKAPALDEAVRRTLRERGMWVHHPQMLQALADKGAQVSFEDRRALLTDELLDEVIGLQLERAVARPPEPGRPGAAYTAALGFEIAPRFYDYAAGAARHATAADLVDMVKLAQMLPQVDTVCAPLTVVDMDPRLEPLESVLTVAQHTDKAISTVSLIPGHHPCFAAFGELLAGDRGAFIGNSAWMTSPLCISRRAGELFRLAPEYGHLTSGAGTMVIAGMSGPITRAGAIVIGAAELLGTWVGALALQPQLVGFNGAVATGVVDPRNGRGCFGGPEPAIQDVGICELFDHCYGGGIGVAGLGYVDGKVPGLQVSFEKVAKSVYISQARGMVPRIFSPGLLDAGRAFSPVQYLIDLEVDQALWGLNRELDVSAESLGMETILDATAEYGSSFLATEHTARHLRGELWLPELMDRAVSYPGPGARLESQVADRAEGRWRELVAAWSPVNRPELDALEAVVAGARQDADLAATETFLA